MPRLVEIRQAFVAIANGTKSSVARVCIEYDCLKPLMDSVWIIVSKRGSDDITSWYLQKRTETAKSKSVGNHWDKPFGDHATDHFLETDDKNQGRKDRASNTEKRRADQHMEVPKHGKQWQVVADKGLSVLARMVSDQGSTHLRVEESSRTDGDLSDSVENIDTRDYVQWAMENASNIQSQTEMIEGSGEYIPMLGLEMSHLGRGHEVSLDGFLQLGTVHHAGTKQADHDMHEQEHYGLNKEISLTISHATIPHASSEGHSMQDDDDDGRSPSNMDPSLESGSQPIEYHPVASRKRKSDSELSYNPYEDVSSENEAHSLTDRTCEDSVSMQFTLKTYP
ncbi:Uncharacterized protein TCM_004265 [Theobroma cacao]|uniref:Uncharacterized protein n=1 Tax=Theobroma cacao TaxID=3641 RepID=A0A061DPK7_THECC|nr:Uncharacterized protein TCM_004265 [Theobroma cacao]